MSGAYGSSHWLYDAEPFEGGQSLRFNDDDSTYLSRTPTSAGNKKTYTFAAWIKRSSHGSAHTLLSCVNVGTSQTSINLNGSDKIEVSSSGSGFAAINLATTALLRDLSAWYHVVVAIDTTQSTSSDRVKVYLNGSQVTSFSTSSYPNQNTDGTLNEAREIGIGRFGQSGYYQYFDGYMADVYFIDGQALDHTSFTKTENNQLKPKEYFGTYGTNGFRLNFQDDVISEGFNAVVYKGTGSTLAHYISGLGFAPNFVWIKNRDATADHALYDSLRTNMLSSNNTAAEVASSGVVAFNSDGFGIGSADSRVNSANSFVAWCWEAGGTPTATNSAGAGAVPTSGSVKIDGANKTDALAGTIPATKISANTDKGFSIVGYTGTGSAGTIAHGLDSAPEFIIVKSRDAARDWIVFHTSLGATKRIWLNYNLAEDSGTAASATWNDTAPTSSVFSVGTNIHSNESGNKIIAYCWHAVSEYSKFGSFTGNGGSQEITVGFKPALVVLKRSSNASNWHVFDGTRQGSNPRSSALNWDRDAAEATNANMQFTDTGFNDNGFVSDSGQTILYMAWADTREAAFFRDVSGNNNNFTAVGLDYRDSMIDTPLTNFNVLNRNHSRLDGGTNLVTSKGGLKISAGSSYGGDNRVGGTFFLSSGKWYWEMIRTDATGLGNQTATGVSNGYTELSSGQYSGNPTSSGASVYEWVLTDRGYACNGSTYTNLSGTIGTVTQGKIVQVALDMDSKKIWFGINNTYSGDPSAGSGEAFSNLPRSVFTLQYSAESTQVFNFGQDSSFSGAQIPQGNGADGEDFYYTPPTGYKSLQLSNLPTPAIADPTAHFGIALYTGNSSTQSITTLNMQPDWIWAKDRSAGNSNALTDAVRGRGRSIITNATTVESSEAASDKDIISFDSNGFTVGQFEGGTYNSNGNSMVAWCWKAGGATPSQTYTVKVVSDSGNKYRFDDFGTSAITLELQEGGTYTFDQSDSSNSGHPLRFSTTANGTHGGGSEYTVGVTTNGTAGSSGAYTQITVASGAPTLYYYCTVHSGMGGQANTNSTFGSTNVKGTIQSVASANTTSGFSIVTYTGNNTAGATVGHSLSSSPEMIWIKGRVATGADGNWNVYAKTQADVINETDYLLLNSTASVTDESTAFNDTAATSSVFSLGTFADSNGSGKTFVAYCFHSVEGFSKIGTYYVNSASTDGEFIPTGFRVTFVLIKSLASGEDWEIWDAGRDPVNVTTKRLKASSSGAEVTSTFIDFLSNGFKLRNTSGGYNSSSNNFLYMAFSESPFKTASAR